MEKIRVLIVDDASVVRRLLTAALNQDQMLEVVGTAADGQIALSRLVDLRPDIVLLDLEMPVMDGLQTLAALRKTHPRLPVIMFSRHTQRGVEATVHALTLGADDYVPKPGDGLDVGRCVEQLLIPKIKLLAGRHSTTGTVKQEGKVQPGLACLPRSGPDAPPSPRRVEIVVIGSSTGGPNALAELFPSLPKDWSIPIAIAQHMPPEFTARLAERLTAKSGLQFREAAADELLSAAQAWVAPGDYHLLVRRAGKFIRLAINQEPPVNSCRPSVDVLFRSAAETFGPGVLAVILTGMGQDGLRGCEQVRAAGGQILAQDEATSVVWSMPGAVAQAGLADGILPLPRLGPEILRRARPLGIGH